MPSWGELLFELQAHKDESGNEVPPLNLDQLRAKYLKKLYDYTGRNIIAYYSGWLKPGRSQNLDITDGDLTGFMNAIKGMDTAKGLDLILHTPGGSPTATEGIVKYLHKKFGNNIRVIVPQMSMSAGTMLACSAKSIVMGLHSCLGPIDPQFNGIPAYNIKREFEHAKSDLEKNPNSKEYWKLQLSRYPNAFYYIADDSIKLSGTLVGEWLKANMFADLDKREAATRTRKVLNVLNSNNKSHSRHFTYDDCVNMGLNVEALEDDQILQDLVLSVHHSYIITIDSTTITKLIENQFENRFITTQLLNGGVQV